MGLAGSFLRIKKVEAQEWRFHFICSTCVFEMSKGLYFVKMEFGPGQLHFARPDVVESFHLFQFARNLHISTIFSLRHSMSIKCPILRIRTREVPTPTLLVTAFSAKRWIVQNDEVNIQWG